MNRWRGKGGNGLGDSTAKRFGPPHRAKRTRATRFLAMKLEIDFEKNKTKERKGTQQNSLFVCVPVCWWCCYSGAETGTRYRSHCTAGRSRKSTGVSFLFLFFPPLREKISGIKSPRALVGNLDPICMRNARRTDDRPTWDRRPATCPTRRNPGHGKSHQSG